MCLFFELVVADSLEIEVHHRAILITQLIHDIIICLFRFIDEDRFQSSLGLLLKDFDHILRFDFLRARGLYRVLHRRYHLKTGPCHLGANRLKALLAIRFEKEVLVKTDGLTPQ